MDRLKEVPVVRQTHADVKYRGVRIYIISWLLNVKSLSAAQIISIRHRTCNSATELHQN